MRQAIISVHDIQAGILTEKDANKDYVLSYDKNYTGEPISLTMPVSSKEYTFTIFPPFFDGLLPEGEMLEGMLRQNKIDRNDYFSQLIAIGRDTVGSVTVSKAAE